MKRNNGWKRLVKSALILGCLWIGALRTDNVQAREFCSEYACTWNEGDDVYCVLEDDCIQVPTATICCDCSNGGDDCTMTTRDLS